MSVIVNDMDMRKKGCCSCPLRTGRYCGQMTENELVQQYVERYERHPDCPLVEIPTLHGKLVDIDAMIDRFWDSDYMEIHCRDLDEIPVIVEAEAYHD